MQRLKVINTLEHIVRVGKLLHGRHCEQHDAANHDVYRRGHPADTKEGARLGHEFS
jgi:hypothetical protein